MPPSHKAREPCPTHDLGGFYDRNWARIVFKLRRGIKWGRGPNSNDPGIEILCCSVI